MREAFLRLQFLLLSLKGDEGNAILELALVVAFLGVPLLLGTAEMGPVVYASAELENAAHSGALYGMQSTTFAVDTAGMTAAAQTEGAEFGTSMVVTPVMFYTCSNAMDGTRFTGSNAQSNAQSACTGSNNHALQFVQVSVTLPMNLVVRCPGMPASFTLTGSSIMEVQQS